MNIFRVATDGGNLANLTQNPSGRTSRHPAYSSDGNRIAFASYRNGSFNIYTMRSSDGGDERGAATSGADELDPSWQPELSRHASSVVASGSRP